MGRIRCKKWTFRNRLSLALFWHYQQTNKHCLSQNGDKSSFQKSDMNPHFSAARVAPTQWQGASFFLNHLYYFYSIPSCGPVRIWTGARIQDESEGHLSALYYSQVHFSILRLTLCLFMEDTLLFLQRLAALQGIIGKKQKKSVQTEWLE